MRGRSWPRGWRSAAPAAHTRTRPASPGCRRAAHPPGVCTDNKEWKIQWVRVSCGDVGHGMLTCSLFAHWGVCACRAKEQSVWLHACSQAQAPAKLTSTRSKKHASTQQPGLQTFTMVRPSHLISGHKATCEHPPRPEGQCCQCRTYVAR